ncbi:osmosensitive K+ channel histidine kinase kdpD [Vibrio ishigakensis]|uniref:histidine kinase n=1 Tax=Vibrio ishigakensis TaxID=1481914 RepID=A0A0B8QAS0_9VIBR|nr:osmosensitive K+ channel histidine kinase kdpD [Vibrio ishigakensis]
MVLLSGCLIAVTYNWQKETIELRTKQNLHKDLATHMREDNPLMIGADYNPVALKSIFHTLMLLGPDFEIYFLDANGNITTHASPEGAELQSSVDVAPITRYLAGEPFPILGDDPRNPDDKKVFSVSALKEGDNIMGYLYVVIGSTRHGEIADAEVDTPYVALAGLVLLSILSFAIGTYLLVRKNLLSPIERVTEELKSQAEHEFRLDPNFVHQVPELVPIANSYHEMAKHIQQQFLHLEYQSSHQRQSLLQLSHDLKTPLSSVLGYLETWQLQNPKSDPLIDVAFRNCVKLSEQLQSLLNQARQETTMPSYEFKLVELAPMLKECAEMVKTQLDRKGLTLSLELTEPLQTVGDRGLLERLVLNLFENAIRHSPNNSEIRCVAEVKAGDIDFTFSNRVQADSESGSLGVGVKIVQSILMLHHSHLETKASDNEYQQRFSLPAV